MSGGTPNDIYEDGTVIGTSGNEMAVWQPGESTSTLTPPSTSGGTKQGVAVSATNWTWETVVKDTHGHSFTDGFRDGNQLGDATVNTTNGNLSGVSVDPIAVNSLGDMISNNVDTASSTLSILSVYTNNGFSGVGDQDFNDSDHQVLSFVPADIGNEVIDDSFPNDVFVVSGGGGYLVFGGIVFWVERGKPVLGLS
ncbi:MAG: hypothetical protein WDN67_04925 [Candidatus Moraniibacteriota bacterium]